MPRKQYHIGAICDAATGKKFVFAVARNYRAYFQGFKDTILAERRRGINDRTSAMPIAAAMAARKDFSDFSVELLDVARNKQDAHDKKNQQIAKLNTMAPHGYNRRGGGQVAEPEQIVPTPTESESLALDDLRVAQQFINEARRRHGVTLVVDETGDLRLSI